MIVLSEECVIHNLIQCPIIESGNLVWLIGYFEERDDVVVLSTLCTPNPNSHKEWEEIAEKIMKIIPLGLRVVGFLFTPIQDLPNEVKSFVKNGGEPLCSILSPSNVSTNKTTDYFIFSVISQPFDPSSLDFYSYLFPDTINKIAYQVSKDTLSTFNNTHILVHTTCSVPVTVNQELDYREFDGFNKISNPENVFIINHQKNAEEFTIISPQSPRTLASFITPKSKSDQEQSSSNIPKNVKGKNKQESKQEITPFNITPSQIQLVEISLLIKQTKSTQTPLTTPVVHLLKDFTHITLTLDLCLYFPHNTPINSIPKVIVSGFEQQFKTMLGLISQNKLASNIVPTIYHFQPLRTPHLWNVYYLQQTKETNEDHLVEQRTEYHKLLILPLDRPLLRFINSIQFTKKIENPSPVSKEAGKRVFGDGVNSSDSRIKDVHLLVTDGYKSVGLQFFVNGSYEYFHYMQDNFNDNGWGCAYRSMQTICSWLSHQKYTVKPIPHHLDIQQTLVSIGDKPSSFVGSTNWIGAFEISLCLENMFGIVSKIMNFSSGSEIPSRAREITLHFKNEGSPIMIGGGVLAYTLLGIDWNEETGDTKFLILDPHYTGAENIKTIKEKGWCAWKGEEIFRKDAFYNLCLPLRPRKI